jgi:GNAT superfamily N-acetyltransferase
VGTLELPESLPQGWDVPIDLLGVRGHRKAGDFDRALQVDDARLRPAGGLAEPPRPDASHDWTSLLLPITESRQSSCETHGPQAIRTGAVGSRPIPGRLGRRSALAYDRLNRDARTPTGTEGTVAVTTEWISGSRDEESESPVTVRHELRPGDVGRVVLLHGTIYAQEYGFDSTFEAYVAGPLSELVRARSERDRLWIAERGDRIVGCVAVVSVSRDEAQLRWLLVDPSARGRGLGRRLLLDAVEFARGQGYSSLFLWTVSALIAAAHLYRSVGFRKVDEKLGEWGVPVVEEKYVLDLPRDAARRCDHGRAQSASLSL